MPSSKQGIPVIADNVQIGQLCAFVIEDGWKIGKVLQFSKYKERTKNAQKYKGTGAEISDSSIGVLCSWYVPSKESPLHFQLNQQKSGFSYFPLSSYLCTLEEGGLTIFTDASVSSTIPSSILSKNTNSTVCQAKEFAIDDNTKAVIQNQLKVHRAKVSKPVSNEQKTIRTIAANVKKNAVKRLQKKANSSKKPLNDVCQLQVKPESSSADIIELSDTSDVETEGSSSEHWLKIGKFTLRAEHKEALSSNKWLNDYHIACAQTLLKSQFPQLGGLQPTIGQEKYLKQLPMDCDSIQVLFIARNHWAAVSTMNCAKGKELVFYDSLNSAVSDETKRLLCKLIHTNDDHFRIRLANVIKQSGVNDCRLFVIAYITHLAFGKDPSCCVFAQSEMRSHLLASFEQQRITPFPVIRETSFTTEIGHSQSLLLL